MLQLLVSCTIHTLSIVYSRTRYVRPNCHVPYGRFSFLTALTKSLARETQGSIAPPSYDGLTPCVAFVNITALPAGHTSSRISPWEARGERSRASVSHLAMQWTEVCLSILLSVPATLSVQWSVHRFERNLISAAAQLKYDLQTQLLVSLKTLDQPLKKQFNHWLLSQFTSCSFNWSLSVLLVISSGVYLLEHTQTQDRHCLNVEYSLVYTRVCAL